MGSRKFLGRYFLEWANCWYQDGLLDDCSRVEELKNFIPLLARPGFANIELGLLEHLAEHVSAKGVDVVRETGPKVGSDAIRAAYIQGQAGTSSRLKVVSRLGALENNVVFAKHHKTGSKEFLTRYFLASVSLRVREMMLVIGGSSLGWDRREPSGCAKEKHDVAFQELESRVFRYTARSQRGSHINWTSRNSGPKR